ncbi:MAG: primosomal protein N' [Gammaproteobacteria bacterium]|nr:primosomal protein N' [Gammaproteobacteria bacterium]
MNPLILQIAVPSPLHRRFDYLPPLDVDVTVLQPGIRLRIPFGRRTTIGVLLAVSNESAIDSRKLKRSLEVLDDSPVISSDILDMVQWASDYYHYPVGEAFTAAMPALLRRGQQPAGTETTGWQLSVAGSAIDTTTLSHAARQAQVIALLRAHPQGLPRSAIDVPASVLRTLADKGWIENCNLRHSGGDQTVLASAHTLNPDQQQAVDTIRARLDGFTPFLLAGVTGSGKTEVYLELIATTLARQQQALLLVPEIGLTPQLLARFQRRFQVPLALLHSGLSDHERFTAWQQARRGEAPIIIGTRSAIFTPMARPGLIVVDEEHDASLKQQDGFRYSARDLAVWRARRLDIPVLLGSATPSLESLLNVEQGRYTQLELPERTGVAQQPAFHLLDVRKQPLQDGLSAPLLQRIRKHLDAGNQVLLFLNRRGYAPTLMCYDCDWVAECQRCDARMTWHQHDQRLHCHHCGSQRAVDSICPACHGSELHPQGQGTERVEQALREHFPDIRQVRIDRDTTRRKGELDRLLEQARNGEGRLLLGTQMLAKGHHFPNVTLVGILDADHGLFSTDFRASERMAQLIVQVAGRAGRHERPGEVIIQTCHPDHPLLQLLVKQGYPAFARAALAERRAAQMPPMSSMALLRAEASAADTAMEFLASVAKRIQAAGVRSVEVWGPVPATMERRAGRYRAQLMLQSGQRGELQRLLSGLVRQLETAKEARRVRWSVDVDPADTY